MLAVVAASSVRVQAPSASARPASATVARIARLRVGKVLAVILEFLAPSSIGDETVGAAIVARGLDAARHAIDAIDAAEQVGLRIGRRGKAVVRTRQVLL